jgi:hypothetical protein
MAYTYVGALVRGRGVSALWVSVDVSHLSLNTLYNKYQYVYLTLSNPDYTVPLYLDMAAVRASIEVNVPAKTVNQWLASLGSGSLPTVTTAPVITSNNILFRDAWQAGYTVQPTDSEAAPDTDLPAGALNDLLVSRASTDYSALYNNVLVTVNGLIHRTGIAPSDAGLYVQSGMFTARTGKDNQLGLLSFEKLGGMQIIPITSSKITNNAVTEPYSSYVYVNLGQSMAGKSLLFVLAGHLHVYDEAYSLIGDRVVRINIDRLPMAQLFFDALANLDCSSIVWSTTTNNPQQIAVDELFSNAVIGAFLKLTQTFFVVVNTADFYVVRHYLDATKLPGRWTCPAGQQVYPLVGGLGRLVEYSPVWENTLYVLRGTSAYDVHYNFETAPWETQHSVAPIMQRRRPITFPNAHLLECGSQSVAA